MTKISFELSNVVQRLKIYICFMLCYVLFYFCSNSNESGRFLTDGITQSSTTNSTFVQCTSTHLTSFAVLVDTSGESVSLTKVFSAD